MSKRNPKQHRNPDHENYELKIFYFPETVADQEETKFRNSFFGGVVDQFGELARSIRASLWPTKT